MKEKKMQRRQFLQNSTLISLTPVIPAFLGRSLLAANAGKNAEKNADGQILVVVQLDGGNDGINTVVPFKDDGYAKHRPTLRLTEDRLVKLNDEIAFHPSMRQAGELFEDGRLSIVHGVGYPNPNRSHFESMNIWHTASPDLATRSLGNGWIGDAISLQRFAHGPHAFHIGDEPLPVALRGRRCTATSMANADDLKLVLRDLPKQSSELNAHPSGQASAHSNAKSDSPSLADFVTQTVSEAYVSAQELEESTTSDSSARYPSSKLGQRLKLVSQTIKSGSKAQVYYTSQGNYDTHAAQLNTHSRLLGTLSRSLKAFMDDMRQSGLDERITVLVFSEFGRRVRENGSLGTDHGTAGPVFLLGTKQTQPFFGTIPSLTDLVGGDLKHSIDFRDVYVSVLTDALGLRKPKVLEEFGDMKFFRKTV